MRATLRFAVALLLLCVASLAATIDGTVVDSSTRTGLAGVTVRFGATTKTDGTGHFHFDDAPNGNAWQFEKDGYVIRSFGKPATTPMVVEMARFASLRGRVFDPDGKAMAGIEVDLDGNWVKTNANGEYTFANVPPGAHQIYAWPADVKPRDKDGDRVVLAQTWYPSVVGQEQAEYIRVAGGDDLRGFDIHVHTVPVHRVRGVMLGLDGKPGDILADVSVFRTFDRTDLSAAFQSGASPVKGQAGPLDFFTITVPRTFLIANTRTDEHGAFELRALPRENYALFATLLSRQSITVPGGIGKTPSGEAITKFAVDLPDERAVTKSGFPLLVNGDREGVRVQLDQDFAIDASVEFPGSDQHETAEALRAVSVTLNGTLQGVRKSGGSFTFPKVHAGDYRVTATPGLPGGYYLAAIMVASQDVSGRFVELGRASPSVRVVYRPNGGTVTGTVEGEADRVVLVPEAALDSMSVDCGRSFRLTRDQTFAFQSLAPGAYYAFAVEHFDGSELYNRIRLARILAGAEVVRVSEGSSVQVNLKAIPLER